MVVQEGFVTECTRMDKKRKENIMLMESESKIHALFLETSYVINNCGISDRKTAEEALKKSEQEVLALVDKLESLNKSMLWFLDILSHELRNPIATIASGLELLNLTADWDKFYKTKEILIRQTNQLCHLVDELLDHTRISSNKMKLKTEPVNLNQLAQLAVEDYNLLFEQKKIELSVDEGNQGPIYISADPQRLRQVIGNLLHNAWKFTNTGGSVILSLYRHNEKAFIRVKDTGLGIAADMIETLFDPFIQAETVQGHNSSGLGLGLAITKEIIQLHKGEIEVHSEGLGKGSEFIICLPIQEQ
ncbi:HAMP domain-containing histidine kinase [Anoxybacterium hadale]|uniref:HAMP domain-containing histidine kinase n=1 Tax=Anoxybacterium hadale TaxID=3408580 RepID=A0ACD1ACY3_9FIRM|nr:HAMP domain-containing histidine kinase [Clostridiales bacterium]